NQVRDLEQLLDKLGVASCHVIGSSAGGPISVLFAAGRPSRVRSLVLCGTAIDLFPSEDRATQVIQAYMKAVDRGGSDALLTERPMGAEASLDALWEPEEMEARGELNAYQSRLTRLVEQAKAMPVEQRRGYIRDRLRCQMS
ncbi:MAG: alpha/beta hydrolase, partial [Deltaproteobacteria bacterium]|nr:alpha/beta hydrolase [Deltaproteobacteria bacterium]